MNTNLACQIRVKNTERYRKKLLGQHETEYVYSDDNPPVEVSGDGVVNNESEHEEHKRAKCPHYRQLTATRIASLVQEELAPSQTLVNCCTTGGEKTRLGAADIEDLVMFGVNPYMHRTAIYRNDPSEPLGITLGKTDSGECNVRLVKDDGPAAKEGTIKVGDLLRRVNGTDTRGFDAEHVIQAVRSSSDPVELDVVRREGRLADNKNETYSRHSACPYYLSRALVKHAEIVFAPYNYLLDPGIREAMSLDMKNSVIVLGKLFLRDAPVTSLSGVVGVNDSPARLFFQQMKPTTWKTRYAKAVQDRLESLNCAILFSC
jgi:Fanconi anemia group J protein